MKRIFDYRLYLMISLMSMLIAGLEDIFRVDIIGSKTLMLIAFYFFIIAVMKAAFDELPSSRKNYFKKIKSLSHIWKKLKRY